MAFNGHLSPPAEHPHVRELPMCVSCGITKERGLVLCWPCHRRFKNGYPLEVQTMIDRIEARSALRDRFAPTSAFNLATDYRINALLRESKIT